MDNAVRGLGKLGDLLGTSAAIHASPTHSSPLSHRLAMSYPGVTLGRCAFPTCPHALLLLVSIVLT
jgi:hypothetical protein